MDPNQNNSSQPPKKDENTPNSQLPKGRGLFPTGLGNFKNKNTSGSSSTRGGVPSQRPIGTTPPVPQSPIRQAQQASALSRPGIAPRPNSLNRPRGNPSHPGNVAKPGGNPSHFGNMTRPGGNPSRPANIAKPGGNPGHPTNVARPGVSPSPPPKSVQPVVSRSPLPQGSSPQGKANLDFEEFRKQKMLQQNLPKAETPSLEPKNIISSDRFQRTTGTSGGMEKKQDRYSLRNDIKAGGLADRERAEKMEGLKGKGKGYQDHRFS